MDILGVEKDRIVKRFLTACQRESEESFLICKKFSVREDDGLSVEFYKISHRGQPLVLYN